MLEAYLAYPACSAFPLAQYVAWSVYLLNCSVYLPMRETAAFGLFVRKLMHPDAVPIRGYGTASKKGRVCKLLLPDPNGRPIEFHPGDAPVVLGRRKRVLEIHGSRDGHPGQLPGDIILPRLGPRREPGQGVLAAVLTARI